MREKQNGILMISSTGTSKRMPLRLKVWQKIRLGICFHQENGKMLEVAGSNWDAVTCWSTDEFYLGFPGFSTHVLASHT